MDFASSNNPVLKYYAKTQGSAGSAPAASKQNMEAFAASNNPVLQHYAKVNTPAKPAAPTTPNTTRADGAGVGGNGYEIQMPKLEVNALGAGGWKRPEAKEKTTPTAADIAAQKVEAEKAAEQLRYLETLNLEEQQKKIDALQRAVNTAPKYNVHAFGGYDPNGQSENETALAKAQEDYNLAKSVQYSVQGQKALEALENDIYEHIDNMALWKISANRFRKQTGKDNVYQDLQALYNAGLTLAEIEQLVDYRKRQINADIYDERVKKMQELASREDLLGISDMGAIAASVASVPLNIASSAGYLDLLRQKAYHKNAGYDRPLDYKTGAMSLYGQASAARETVSQRIEDNAKTELGGQVGAFLYNTGMSMADSAVIAGLGVLGLGTAGTLLLGGSAATAAAVDAKNRGASDAQALWSGAFAGAAETVFEKISLDELMTGRLSANVVGSEFKKLMAAVGTQAAVEGSSELFTEFANFVSDSIVMGGLSSYQKKVNEYMMQGMSMQEAKEKASADFAKECAMAFVGGAISGGVMGGGANTLRGMEVTMPTAPQTVQGGAETAQEAQNAPVTGNETPAPAEGAQRPQNTPMSFENTAAADILMGAAPQKQRAGFTSLENAMANQFERETGISIESVESILGGLANGDYNSANWVARIAQDAKDPKMVVVAHELTHHLQTLAPQEYESFRKAVADYFTRAGGEAALTDMMNRYRSAYGAAGQNLSDSAVMDEMAADFTEVLLTDADLFGQFARENRTVAERLLDALRAFIEKIRATFTGRARDAAAQEATGKTLSELEMIAEQWQGVYRAAAAAYEQNANTAAQEGDGAVRYKILKDVNGNKFVDVTEDIFDPTNGESVARTIQKILSERFGNIVNVNGQQFQVNKTTNDEFRRSESAVALMRSDPVAYNDKLKTVANADEIIRAAKNWIGEERNHNRKDDIVEFGRGNVMYRVGDNGYVADVLVGIRANGAAVLYDLVNIYETNIAEGPVAMAGDNDPQRRQGASAEVSVPNLFDGVKGNMSQLKSTASLRQMMAEMPQQMMIRMPRLTTVAQDEAEVAGLEAAPVEDTVQLPQLGLTDADVPGTEPLTRQDIAREMAWRARMANEPAAPQVMGEVKLPDLSADMEEAGMGVADFTGNVETVPQEATAEILSALEDLSRDMEAPMETPTDATVRDAESLISAETVEAPQSLKEKAAESWAFFKRKMVDSGEAVTQIGKAINDKYLYPFYNMARASASAGANMIAEEQTDVNGRTVGESLNAIFDPIRAKGKDYYVNFQTYMYDLHNIARMSMDKNAQKERDAAEAAKAEFLAEHPKFINMTREQARRKADSIDELEAEEAREYLRLERWQNRAASMGNKPVFDYEFSAEMSRGRSERLLREHPEFAQYREQVRKYIDNLMKYRVDSGLMTQKNADFLREYYPDYVPTDRHQAFEDFGPEIKEKRVRIAKTVKRAKGGNEKLVPLHEALGKQTMQVVREGSKNRFGARLLQDYTANASDAGIAKYIRDAKETEADFDINSFDEEKKTKENTFSVYFDGKLYEMEVNDALLEAVQALSPSDNLMKYWPVELSHNLNKLYKAMITGYNPTFAIRNTVRDLQTAGLYSRNFAAWAKNYPKALQEIAKDGEMWKQYKALGGDFSSVYDYATGTVRKPNTMVGKVADKMQALNMAMEQAPRLAEFMAVMEKGDGSMESAMDAMLAAADVTTNFGRSGTWGKVLNAHIVPFLNPGIQGFDKMVRYATQSRSGKQWLMMAARAAALGIAPSLINALLYHDDEEWEELRDSDKDTNYMFKLKDGLWLKIPKGRELSVLGIAADRVGDAIRGEDVNIRATLNTIGTQVAPANPLNENIAKAWLDADLFNPSSPGRTWYGGDIEGQRLQNYAPGERYDSSTDVVSKAIGGALNLSPKKLNYLADQYTGVVGDIVLPLLTPQAERDMFSKAFTVDSISSNELSSKFYEKADELTYAKYGGDAVAAVVSRYWNSISSDVSKLYGEIRNVENSDLSNREKKERVQELQRQINAIQREALATVDQYTAAVESSLFGDDEDAADFAYRETNREVFGAKSALETYNKDVYAKAQEAAKNGVSYEAYYDYYFATKDIEGDKDASGKTIPGSKREKVLAEINAMDLTVEQKNALYYASGYAESTLYEAPWYTIQMPRL